MLVRGVSLGRARERRVTGGRSMADCPRNSRRVKFMKTNRLHNSRYVARGFTLIELLVVISIIGLLAGLLLPALGRAQLSAKKNAAKMDIKNLTLAISEYENHYSRLPAVPITLRGGTVPDMTFGFPNLQAQAGVAVIPTNTDVMVIMMDVVSFSAMGNAPTVNAGHARNPQQDGVYKPSKLDGSPDPGPGVSSRDYQIRDPWRHPYIITLDTSGDGRCRDAFYCSPTVSRQSGNLGYNGLSDNGSGYFEFPGQAMIWSLGPDGKLDPTAPANAGANKDNILGWQ